MIGSPIKVLRKIDVHVCLGILEYSHQMLFPGIVDEVILGMEIMNAYRFVVNLRENVLRLAKKR